jgi:hypothetical protein
MSLFDIYIDANAKPTIEGYNALSKGILPKGIYSGGAVTQGPGRSVTVGEFIAKSPDGFSIVGHEQNIEITSPNSGDWAIVLYSRAWKPGDPVKSHSVEFRVIPWTTQTPAIRGYSDMVTPDPDRDNYILFARVTSLAVAGSVRINPEDIDSSFAERIQINQPSTQVLSGVENFTGPAGVKVNHNLGHLNYRVQITPSQQPNVGIGDIWTEKYPTYFIVKCSGEVVTTFDWALFVTLNKFGLSPQAVYGSRFGHALISSVNGSIVKHSEDSKNYFTCVAATGITPKFFVASDNQSYQTTLTTIDLADTPVVWELISGNVIKNLIIYSDVVVTANHAEVLVDYTGLPNSVKVFAALKNTASINNPIVALSNEPTTGKLKVDLNVSAPDGTMFTIIVFQNPGAYANGSVTGCSNSFEVVHNLDFQNYVPLISLRNVTVGSVTGYSLEVKPNSFVVHFPSGTVVDFDWLIVPSLVG